MFWNDTQGLDLIRVHYPWWGTSCGRPPAIPLNPPLSPTACPDQTRGGCRWFVKASNPANVDRFYPHLEHFKSGVEKADIMRCPSQQQQPHTHRTTTARTPNTHRAAPQPRPCSSAAARPPLLGPSFTSSFSGFCSC